MVSLTFHFSASITPSFLTVRKHDLETSYYKIKYSILFFTVIEGFRRVVYTIHQPFIPTSFINSIPVKTLVPE